MIGVLDPAERHFWLVDQLVPTNVMVWAELDQPLDLQGLRSSLDDLQRQQFLLRTRFDVVGDRPVFVETDNEIPLDVVGATGANWHAEVERALDSRVPPRRTAGALPVPAGRRRRRRRDPGVRAASCRRRRALGRASPASRVA